MLLFKDIPALSINDFNGPSELLNWVLIQMIILRGPSASGLEPYWLKVGCLENPYFDVIDLEIFSKYIIASLS